MSSLDQDTVSVSVAGLDLLVLANLHDKNWYARRETVEEIRSRWYPLVLKTGVRTIIDVGANYGMVSLSAHKVDPKLNVIAIGADPRLVPLIERNFINNGLVKFDLINAIAGLECGPGSFSQNPNSTLDNRVDMPGWDKVEVPIISLDSLQDTHHLQWPIYIKVDTQGFERSVFRGAERLLASSDKWVIKTEFAPMWLESQRTDPSDFLKYLVDRYTVFEAPARVEFAPRELDQCLGEALEENRIEGFVEYVRNLNENQRGWVDLIVIPRRKPQRQVSFRSRISSFIRPPKQ
jgi:FkbM family methyltransferase